MPKRRTPYTPTRLPKRAMVEMRNGITLILGLFDEAEHGLKEFITVRHPLFGIINASLLKVTNRTVQYRQAMKENESISKGTVAFHPGQS